MTPQRVKVHQVTRHAVICSECSVVRHAVICSECGTVGTRAHERETKQLRRIHIANHEKKSQESLSGPNNNN